MSVDAPSWEVRQTRRFARTYKKLINTALIADTDAAVAVASQDPEVGERKKGRWHSCG